MDAETYLIDLPPDPDALLDAWRWLLGGRAYDVFRATAMGDLILEDTAGRFHLLDLIDGRLRPLARTEPELWATLTDRRTRRGLLGTFIVRGMRSAGVELGPHECYAPAIPPILGGALNDLRPCPIAEHAAVMGRTHRQLRDDPPVTSYARPPSG